MTSLAKSQLVIVWRVYEPCNLACHFCGYSREIIRKRNITEPEQILAFGKTLSDFQQETDTEVLISWLGGEPLLWKELPKLSGIFRHELGIKLGITTNGTLLERESVRVMLMKDYSLLTVSLDGFSNVHDFHRGETGLYEKIKRYINVLLDEITRSRSALKVRINTILMRENIHEFESFCMEVASWGVQELTFNQLGGIDRPEFYPDHRLLPEQVESFATKFPRIQMEAYAKGLTIFGGQPYLERLIATSRDISISVEDCNPGRKFLFINEENLVSPCNFTTVDYGIPLAELKNVTDLINLQDRFRYKQKYERAMPCNNCHSTQIFEKFNRSLEIA